MRTLRLSRKAGAAKDNREYGTSLCEPVFSGLLRWRLLNDNHKGQRPLSGGAGRKTEPSGIPDEVAVLKQPLKNIYLAATSAMDLFCSLDGTDRITLSGTDASGWYIEEARSALEDGRMLYAGKYNAPDYERILSMSCDLAIESTMIYHSPEVKEQLEQLGIPVLVERSSYESHPLGRMEWLKLYAVLLGREEQAERCFDHQVRQLLPVINQENTGKTAAFFISAATVMSM